jgi:hypothetical protein
MVKNICGMNNEDDNLDWAAKKLKCDLCSHEYISVHVNHTPKLECSNCGNISYYTVIETYTKKE